MGERRFESFPPGQDLVEPAMKLLQDAATPVHLYRVESFYLAAMLKRQFADEADYVRKQAEKLPGRVVSSSIAMRQLTGSFKVQNRTPRC